MENAINQRLKILIKNKGLNANSFANRIGVSAVVLYNILKGRNNPSYDIFYKILEEFPDVDLNWLVMGQENSNKSLNMVEDKEVTYSPKNNNKSYNLTNDCREIKTELNFTHKILEAKEEVIKKSEILLNTKDELINAKNDLLKMAEDLIQTTKEHLNDKNELFKETMEITKDSLRDKDQIINLLQNK